MTASTQEAVIFNPMLMDKKMSNLSEEVLEFFECQLRAIGKKNRGARFTFNDKCLALSIFKYSPKAYKILSRIFTLPSKNTLKVFLKKISLYPGLNPIILDCLKISSQSLKPADRICSLIFDEMSINPHLFYNETNDQIVGFVDYGTERKREFADHVIVYMVRGLRKKWKQPLCFGFVESTIPTIALKNQVKNIISAVQKTGLKIIATVCDQGATNRAAINSLLKDTTEEYLRNNEEEKYGFQINGENIIPLFDPPHLIKLIRNHLLTKDLHLAILLVFF